MTKRVFLFVLVAVLLVDLNDGRRYQARRENIDDDDDDDFTGQQTESLEILSPERPLKPHLRPDTGDRFLTDLESGNQGLEKPHKPHQRPPTRDRFITDLESGSQGQQQGSQGSQIPTSESHTRNDSSHGITTQEFLRLYREIKDVERKLIKTYTERGGNVNCLTNNENENVDDFDEAGRGTERDSFGGRCSCPPGPPGLPGPRGLPGLPGLPGRKGQDGMSEDEIEVLVTRLMPTMCQRFCIGPPGHPRGDYMEKRPKRSAYAYGNAPHQ